MDTKFWSKTTINKRNEMIYPWPTNFCVKFCEIDMEDLFLQTTLFLQIAYKLVSA